MAPAPMVDVLIIDGGPAGFTTASTIARQVQTCIVFDDGTYRNKLSNDMHMHLQGKKLVLATGVEDIYPAIEGYAECWPSGIYHCFFCKGFEDRGAESSGILAVDILTRVPYTMHAARHATQLSKKVVVYTNGDEALATEFVTAFGGSPVFSVDSRKIKKLVKGPKRADVILQFEDGTEATEAWLGHAPLTKAKDPFAEQLGLACTPTGDLVANPPFNQSSEKGVFVAGDNSALMKITPNSLYTGSLAGAGVSAQLVAEKLGQPSMV